MKLEIITLADFVQVFEGGKLTIVGTFDTFNAVQLPFSQPFGIAVKIVPHTSEYGKTYKIELNLRKANISKEKFKAEVDITYKQAADTGVSAAVIALNIVSLTFDAAGLYVLEVKCRGKLLGSTKLLVRQIPDSTPKVEEIKTSMPTK